MNLKAYVPALDWLTNYKIAQFKGGLIVGVMLIPQGMAYANTLPLIIYAILGTSRQLAIGLVLTTKIEVKNCFLTIIEAVNSFNSPSVNDVQPFLKSFALQTNS